MPLPSVKETQYWERPICTFFVHISGICYSVGSTPKPKPNYGRQLEDLREYLKEQAA